MHFIYYFFLMGNDLLIVINYMENHSVKCRENELTTQINGINCWIQLTGYQNL